MEPCGVLEEPRPPAELGGGAAVLRRSEPAGEAVHERRALHGGRHADSGVGLAEELSLEGRLWLWRWRELPRREALEPHTWIDHRSGRAAVQEELRQGIEVELSGPRPVD